MYTPGPWTAEGENVLAVGVPVALARNVDSTRATLDANARLIASAPALLEALEAWCRWFKQGHKAPLFISESAIKQAKGE